MLGNGQTIINQYSISLNETLGEIKSPDRILTSYFKLNDNKKLMGIEGEEYDIGNVSVKSITKFRV